MTEHEVKFILRVMKTIILNDTKHLIQPSDIDTEQDFVGSQFNKSETETSARVLCLFAQKQKSWKPFKKKALDKFWEENVWFNGLDEKEYIHIEGGTCYFTKEFVATCYAASPA